LLKIRKDVKNIPQVINKEQLMVVFYVCVKQTAPLLHIVPLPVQKTTTAQTFNIVQQS